MESPQNKEESSGKKESTRSLIEQKKWEAFETVLEDVDARLSGDSKETFSVHGSEYPLTSGEDAMVAYAQHIRTEVRALYDETIAKDKYREEQALVKILRLFEAHEKMVALYAELKSYYPSAAVRVERHLPSLRAVSKHGDVLFEKFTDTQK